MTQDSSIVRFLGENATLIGAIGVIVGIIAGIIGFLWKLPTERRAKKISAVEAVEKYYKESKELGLRAATVPNLLKIWDAKLPEGKVPEARNLMRETYTLYHGIYSQHRAGNFPAKSWDAAKQEMQHFLSYGYIQRNLTFADQIDEDFGRFMRGLTPKRRQN